jgi:hypothetical protein
MFPLHLLLSPQSTLPETPAYPAKTLSEPAMTGVSEPAPERSATRKQRRAAWALTWLGPETAIVPPVGMNVPEMGR